MDINVMMQYVTYGLALIGVLAFLVVDHRAGNQGNAGTQ